jgi:hypothetical protein
MGAPADYNEVKDRLIEFRERYPAGSLQQQDLRFIECGGKSWVVYVAAAYRTPDDPRPGHGSAWEQVPGATAFTKDSELQNAETSAWGRALIAVGAADAKKGITSADEVRNRQAERTPPPPADPGKLQLVRDLYAQLPAGVTDKSLDDLLAFASGSDAAADATVAKLTAAVEATP